jgi:flagellar motor switch protein FliN/FliY
MSDNKILSQEEINALFKDSGTDDNETLNVDDFLTPIEQDALGEIGNISLGNSATTLSILVNQEVDITTPTIGMVDFNKLKKEFPQPHVSVHVDYTDGFEGMNVLVVKEEDAKIIADLMMGGGGIPGDEPLSDLHVSAVQEAMNQMMGAAATSMSTLFNRLVNITPPGIELLNEEVSNLPAFSENIIIKVSFRLKIGSFVDSNIMQLIPLSFGKTMVRLLMGGEGEAVTSHEEKMTKPEGAGEVKRDTESHSAPETKPKETSHELKSVAQPGPADLFPSFEQEQAPTYSGLNLNLLLDIPLEITVELGRTTKRINDILELSDGSVIELEKLAGEPVDILANQKLIARGEVVVIEENFGVRITEVLSQSNRLQKLN